MLKDATLLKSFGRCGVWLRSRRAFGVRGFSRCGERAVGAGSRGDRVLGGLERGRPERSGADDPSVRAVGGALGRDPVRAAVFQPDIGASGGGRGRVRSAGAGGPDAREGAAGLFQRAPERRAQAHGDRGRRRGADVLRGRLHRSGLGGGDPGRDRFGILRSRLALGDRLARDVSADAARAAALGRAFAGQALGVRARSRPGERGDGGVHSGDRAAQIVRSIARIGAGAGIVDRRVSGGFERAGRGDLVPGESGADADEQQSRDRDSAGALAARDRLGESADAGVLRVVQSAALRGALAAGEVDLDGGLRRGERRPFGRDHVVGGADGHGDGGGAFGQLDRVPRGDVPVFAGYVRSRRGAGHHAFGPRRAR